MTGCIITPLEESSKSQERQEAEDSPISYSDWSALKGPLRPLANVTDRHLGLTIGANNRGAFTVLSVASREAEPSVEPGRPEAPLVGNST